MSFVETLEVYESVKESRYRHEIPNLLRILCVTTGSEHNLVTLALETVTPEQLP